MSTTHPIYPDDSSRPLTEAQRKLWREMLNSELNSEYYSILAAEFAKKDKFTKIFLAIMSSGTVAGWAIWNDAETYPHLGVAWRIVSGIAALTSIALPFLNYSKKVEWATALKIAYEATAKDFEIIWIQRSSKNDKIIIKETQDMLEKERNLSSIESHFPERDDKLLTECQNKIKKRRGIK